ncbi:MAG: hypothetical protein RR400_02220 [Clostridia bacterium]
MSEKNKNNWLANSKLLQKLKGTPHIGIIIAAIFGAIILLLYFSAFPKNFSKNEKVEVPKSSVSEFVAEIGGRLSSTISNIAGAGKISVMVTLKGGFEYVYATSTEDKLNSSTSDKTNTSTTIKTSEPILVQINGKTQPLIIKEIPPEINGILIVSSGANDVNVRLNILRAVGTLLNVPTTNIEILVGNK